MTMSCPPQKSVVGTRPRVRLTFWDENDDLADPSTITVKVKAPGGTTTTWTSPDATITQESTGVWVFQFPAALTVAGDYWVYAVGSGGGADVASEIKFTLRGVHVPLP